MEKAQQAMKPPIGTVKIADCTGREVPVVGQAVVNIKYGDFSCDTPMLLIKTNSNRAECLRCVRFDSNRLHPVDLRSKRVVGTRRDPHV